MLRQGTNEGTSTDSYTGAGQGVVACMGAHKNRSVRPGAVGVGCKRADTSMGAQSRLNYNLGAAVDRGARACASVGASFSAGVASWVDVSANGGANTDWSTGSGIRRRKLVCPSESRVGVRAIVDETKSANRRRKVRKGTGVQAKKGELYGKWRKMAKGNCRNAFCG